MSAVTMSSAIAESPERIAVDSPELARASDAGWRHELMILDRINEHVAELRRDRNDASLHVVDTEATSEGHDGETFRVVLTFVLSDGTRFTLSMSIEDLFAEIESRKATETIVAALRTGDRH